MLNGNFICNLIEKIVYSDIEVRFKMLNDSMGKVNSILDRNIHKIKRESDLEAKIDDMLAYLKPESSNPDLSPSSKVPTESTTFDKTNAF